MKQIRCFQGRIALLAALTGVIPLAAQPLPPPERIVFPDPLSPAASLAAIQVPEELRVELVAAEPMVMDPIDVAWGADGRLWVVEMGDYPLGVDGRGGPGGRIRVLESTRQDGTYDKMTLFAEGLSFPTSVMPWREGVLVTAAPNVFYFEDTDGDGRADRTTKLFTGLGEGNQQHQANGLQWGMDGWLYMANGGTRGMIVSTKTGTALEMGRDVRIKPDEGRVELQSGRSQYGRSRDDWGNWFGGNNANPIWHYALEDHYLRRNPYLAPPNSTVTVPEIPGAAPVFPRSQTLARFNNPRHYNHFTSACGVMIYRDDFLGSEYAGNVLVCEPVHNLVHRELIEPRGTTFFSRRSPREKASEFLASSDNWSRFTSVRAGPDGALYIVDMYRLVIEHPQYIPEAWLKQLGDLRAGADKGRIYRVRPRRGELRPTPRLDQADAAGLVAAMTSPSGLVRDLAQQQLLWRQESGAIPGLEVLLNDPSPSTRVQVLCTLDLLGALKPAQVARLLNDPHPGVRRQAVRLSEQFAKTGPELLNSLTKLVSDPDAAVRQQVAYSLGEWRGKAAGIALAELARSSDDPFIVAAAMSSALPHAMSLVAQLKTSDRIDRALIDLATGTLDVDLMARLLELITAPRDPAYPPSQFVALTHFLEGLNRQRRSLAQYAAGNIPSMARAAEAAARIIAAARERVGAPDATDRHKLAALPLLGRDMVTQEQDFKLLTSLLSLQSSVELQLAAVARLGALNLPSIPPYLLSNWAGFGAGVQDAVLDLFISRTEWTDRLLDRLETDGTMLRRIDARRRMALMEHADKTLAARARLILSAQVDSNRQAVIDRYLGEMARMEGQFDRGQTVFTRACSACHRFGSVEGGTLGPDLASVSDRSAGYLVTHVLDPNRSVDGRYLLHTAQTRDGRTLSGMLADEAGNSIRLMGLDGKTQSILRNELESVTVTDRSLMPEGLEAAIEPQEMADLVAYLADMRQAPPPRRRRQ